MVFLRRTGHVVSILTLLVAIATAVQASAQSQPPTPSGTEERQAPQSQATPDADHARNQTRSPTVPVPDIGVVPPNDCHPHDHAEYQNYSSAGPWWTDPTTLATVLVAIFTGLLVWFTWLQLRLNWRSEAHLKSVERAYVAIRHMQSGGEKWGSEIGFFPRGEIGSYKLDVRVVNSGHTPAVVIEGLIQPVSDLPGRHFHRPREIDKNAPGYLPGDYLHPGGYYRKRMKFWLAADEERLVKDNRMWLVGFVDYRDTFGIRHRSGFCRHVKADLTDMTKNNLEVLDTTVAYNYDCELDEHGDCKGHQPEVQS